MPVSQAYQGVARMAFSGLKAVYVKEKELDKKALNAAYEVGDAMKSAGKVIENKLSKLSNK